MKKLFLFILTLSFITMTYGKGPERYFYQIKIYHLKTAAQEERVDRFLQNAWLPALHRAGIKNVGVFKPVAKDTAEQLIYVFIPFKTLDQFNRLEETLQKDGQYVTDGKDYLNAVFNDIPYVRIESILLRAFPDMPQPAPSQVTGPKANRVYELRSYEGPTEKYFANKVKMFNEGGEVKLFKRLNFNAVFYAEVISGSRMPNLMYMTTFNDKASRDEHWKAFSADPEWKKLSAMEEYQHNVAKSNIYFLYPTEYSDL